MKALCLITMLNVLMWLSTAYVHAATSIGAAHFEQLGELLPTPGYTRTASGAPGPAYWQQRADYEIDVTLDDEKQQIQGEVAITYFNYSPHALKYIWVQLDQNRFRPDSDDVLTRTAPGFEELPYDTMADLLARDAFDGGAKILSVVDAQQNALPYNIVKTMMRIELPEALGMQGSTRFTIKWQHNIVDAMTIWSRGGYEHFPKDDNYIYEIAQWFPRMASYTDYQGWQHKQFLGRGEFTLELGDYVVNITVPADHIVAATGELQNTKEVLTEAQQQRFEQAKTADKIIFVVTPEEALENQKEKSTDTKTWTFKAENVRDFAFASSRKFIWDAMATRSGETDVLAMSFYPNEARPLWDQYSTQAIVHTIDVYSRYTFDYPYPVSISVNGPIGGMEYPMITFNKPRPYEDGTYWDQTQEDQDNSWERSKYGLISVIIHEVGHNYFPMIVNSDERQWTWMDEGLNTFLQFLAEQAWEDEYPSRRGEPKDMVEYMTSDRQVPIMTNSESILQFGSNAYGKPATALNVLRESILGRELFDYAFREYAQRWKFKRPTPADFFRTMEDASGIDLDWFWRGWFYSTAHVDISLDKVTLYQLDSQNPDIEKEKLRKEHKERPQTRSELRNADQEKRISVYPELKDFYNEFDEFAVTPHDYSEYQKFLESLKDREKILLNTGKLFYAVDFTNHGGLVTPLPIRLTFADDSTEEVMIPAEVWRRNAKNITKLFITDKEIAKVEFDPYLETADADVSNNQWPPEVQKSRFQLFKQQESPNFMLRMKEPAEKAEEEQ
ncbi:MAG: M1 family metallopeptidase [Pseudomonadota bacterium]